MTKNSVLFVSHDASATGAPFLLLHLLRWLRTNAKLDCKIVLKKTGPLESQFAEIAPVAVLARSADSLHERVLERLSPYRFKRAVDEQALRRALGRTRFGLVYSNTLVNGALLKTLPDQSCPLISHAHELEYMIRRHTTPDALAYTLRRTTQFIAGSSAVALNLVDNHEIDRTRIEVVHEFVPIQGLDRARLDSRARQTRAELHIPENAFVVGSAGTIDWRKGYDLFIPLALELLSLNPKDEAHFVWVGNASDRAIPIELAYDIRKLGLERRIHFVGYQRNYLDYLAMFDALCLLSREDPFPLIVLECAGLAKPVLCFAGSGGSPEFVENDSGVVVPYLDIRVMAARLLELVENPALRNELGRRGQAKVLARHDVAVVGPRILEIIVRCLSI
jgi:glycosyltransferase involved in cell wall biosynthesis